MAFPSRKETYDSNTPSNLSNRTSMNGAQYRRSSKGTTIQSYQGSISNSSVHANDTTHKTRKDPFNGTGRGSLHPISHRSSESSTSGYGNCPTISDHKSSHRLGKSTSTFRNQSPSTETTQSYQAPISRPRAQEPISRPQKPISRSQEPISLPQEPISRSQELVSRPQATDSTRSHAFAQPTHSRTYSYALNPPPPPPPPAPIPVPEPIPYLPRPVPRRSRMPPQPLLKRLFKIFGPLGFPSLDFSPKSKYPPQRRYRRRSSF